MAEEAEAQEDTVETLEAEDVETSGWSKMDSGQRDDYVAALHEKLAAEKAEDAPPADDKAKPSRDDAGRFAKAVDDTAAETNQTSGRDETPASDDSAPAEAKGEEVPKTDWRDAAVKDLATAYGIDDETLAAVPSREVLDLTLKMIDRKAFMERTAAQTSIAETQNQQVKQSEKTTSAVSEALAKIKAFQLDEELGAADAPKIRDVVSATATALEQVIAFQQQQQEMQAQQQLGRIREVTVANLQKLGFTELYGEPGKTLTPKQRANVDAVFQDHLRLGADLERRGGRPTPTPELLKRSVFSVHGEEVLKQQEQLSKLKAQSSRRTGVGSTHSPAASNGATPYERAVRNLPALRRQMDLTSE